MTIRSDILGPEVGLHTNDVLLLLGSERGVQGFVAVDGLHRYVASDGEGLGISVFGLIVIKIHVYVGRHDAVVPALGCLKSASDAAPGVHGSTGSKRAFENLVPPYDTTAMGIEELLGMGDDEALQIHLGAVLGIVFETELPDASLTLRTLLPAGLGTLVATYVDIFGGEHVDDLGKHVGNKLQRGVVASAEHIVRHAPHLPHLVRTARAPQLGVGGQRGLHVSGKVNLGDHGDVALGSIGHDVATLVLSVEVGAVGDAVVGSAVAPDDGLCTLGTDGVELGVFLQLKAPALVVGEVPVEAVHIVKRKHVDEALHGVDRKEVARHVEVGTTVAEAGIVGHRHGREHYCPTLHYGQSLAQGLHTIEHTGRRGSCDGHAIGIHHETVALRIIDSRIESQRDGARQGIGSDSKVEGGLLLDVLGKEVGIALHDFIA